MNNRLGMFILCFFGGMVFLLSFTFQTSPVTAQESAPTPTYDPLAQPELPPNPTDLEMGHYLFWRHCMPCHGDVGQGLTEDFRVLWEDHQNCWDRGCHGGKRDDEGFPIPTIVPAIATGDHLSKFASENDLFEYLKATHPPQYPGHLKEDEYRIITDYVFHLNDRDASQVQPTPTPMEPISTDLTNTPTPTTLDNGDTSKAALFGIGFGFIFLAFYSIWHITKKGNKK